MPADKIAGRFWVVLSLRDPGYLPVTFPRVTCYLHAIKLCGTLQKKKKNKFQQQYQNRESVTSQKFVLHKLCQPFHHLSSFLLHPYMECMREESPKKRVAAPSRRGWKDNGESCRRGRGKKSHKGINVRRDSSLMARKLRRAPGRGEHARTSRGTSGTMTREGFSS